MIFSGANSARTAGRHLAGSVLIAGGLAVAITAPAIALPASVVGWGPRSFAELARRTSPSVVNISVVREVAEVPLFGPPGYYVQKGIGSGFVIDPAGLILTNDHVVEGKKVVTVTFPDGRRMRGKVLGFDSNVDVALVKVPATHLPALRLADSNTAQAGDWVLAFGSPLGLQRTVTAGILSAVNREFSQSEHQSYLQTDAAINPGNSGGPLVLLDGLVVGMNTFIARGAQGIGFAIPSNTLRSTIAQIRLHGTVARPWLGVTVAKLTPELARYLGVRVGKGIVVVQVSPGSPAARVGLEAGDILLLVDGLPLSTPEQLVAMLHHKRPGQSVRISVERGRFERTLAVRLGAAGPSAPSLPG